MKRTHILCVALACGVLATAPPLLAQTTTPASPAAPAPLPGAENWFAGEASLLLLGRDDVDSAKFQEYREVPKGVSMTRFSFQGNQDGKGFALFGENIARSNQRYFGGADIGWLGVTFDYNQIPHNMGFDGRVIHTEENPELWEMSATLRKSLGDAVDATPTAGRTYPFYVDLLAPTIASAGYVDVTSLRERGNISFRLPFGFSFTYLRDVKTGSRGASGGDILGTVSPVVDVLEPLNEVTQDFGIRWAYNFRKMGSAYVSFNQNLYNDRVNELVIDNPFRATDLAYTSAAVPGGPAQVRFGAPPDNEASRFAFGGQIKLPLQTRIGADLSFQTMTQDQAFLPFTINTAIFTPAGAPATGLSVLPQASLDGKIDTTMFNVSFVSRPIAPLWIRARYRTYDLENNTTPISWLGGSTSGSPDRSWTTTTASAEAPYGYITANPYSNSTDLLDLSAAFDLGVVTIEGAYRYAQYERTYREATSGDENGYAISAVFDLRDWLTFRGRFGQTNRTAEGETVYGFQADEAERDRTRAGFNIDFTPWQKLGFVFSYYHWNDDFPNRPDRVQVSGGVPVPGAAPIPGTPSGLLEASYDTYSIEAEFTPSERFEVGGYYTYEKDASTNQWSTTTGANLNNLLNYKGTDRGDTFGANALIHFVPDKWTLSFLLRHQNVDGLMDITAAETGSFYTPGRCQSACSATTTIPPLVLPGTGGAADIFDYDDTDLTTVVADMAWTFARAWTWGFGYAYEEYSQADAFTSGTTMFPQSVLFFMKANDGDYTANVVYTRLNFRF